MPSSSLPRPVERALDAALSIPAWRVTARIDAMRDARPGANVDELVTWAGDKFRREASLSSGAVGAGAAYPGLGTAAATALTVGQTALFATAAVTYILTVAELRGIRVVTPERRRTLVLSALLGEEGSEAVQGQLGLSSLFWAAQSLAQLPIPTAKSINAKLAKRYAARAATKGSALALGRLLPFGAGAVIGWVGGRALANQVIEGAQAALGNGPISGSVSSADGNVEVIEA